MRLCLIALLMSGLFAEAAGDPYAAIRQHLDFDKHWGLFLRRETGCPDDGPTNGQTCNFKAGYYDYQEYHESCLRAVKMFGLQGTCP